MGGPASWAQMPSYLDLGPWSLVLGACFLFLRPCFFVLSCVLGRWSLLLGCISAEIWLLTEQALPKREKYEQYRKKKTGPNGSLLSKREGAKSEKYENPLNMLHFE